jgi:DNA polymerase alpha-associated DNA helicase A
VACIRILYQNYKAHAYSSLYNISFSITDNLVERMINYEGIRVVRIGHPAKVTNDVIPHTLDVLCCDTGSNIAAIFKAEMDKLKLEQRRSPDEDHRGAIDRKITILNRAFRQASSKSVNQVMSAANVTFSTLSGYANLHLFNTIALVYKLMDAYRCGSFDMRNKIFDVVIIDEAAQATEPECWIALLKGSKAILVSKSFSNNLLFYPTNT